MRHEKLIGLNNWAQKLVSRKGVRQFSTDEFYAGLSQKFPLQKYALPGRHWCYEKMHHDVPISPDTDGVFLCLTTKNGRVLPKSLWTHEQIIARIEKIKN